MNEKVTRRREWVKTAAIIFLSVMLVLTFFSNSIMNYSLPEVATQYVMSGSITARIRGTGVVESGDPYNVEVTESRKVASVAVREGDVVQKGDVLIYLEDEESEELQAAQAALEKAQEDYDKALLRVEITTADIQAAAGGVSTENYRYQITRYQNEIKAEEDKIGPLEEQLVYWTQQIQNIDTQLNLEDTYDATAAERVVVTSVAKDNAEAVRQSSLAVLNSAISAKDAVAQQLEQAKQDSVTDNNAAADAALAQVAILQERLKAAEEDVRVKQESYNSVAATARQAAADYEEAVRINNERKGSPVNANLNELKATYEVNRYTVQQELDAVETAKADKETALNELLGRISKVLELDTYLSAIADAQEQVDELRAKTIDTTITAPIAGTISSLNVVAGETTSAAVPVVVMQPEGKGYTLSFSVTNDQARRLAVGDRADLVNAWRYEDVQVILASIKPDRNNPGQQKELTFEVTGNVVAGQTLNLSVGQQSANYDYIVPNSALREDNNGQFILIVESKASPLGTRYKATRVDVQVIASDDTQSAITGGVSGYEFVITTSTKPVEAGAQVRLTD